jgi:hypothetical protein
MGLGSWAQHASGKQSRLLLHLLLLHLHLQLLLRLGCLL